MYLHLSLLGYWSLFEVMQLCIYVQISISISVWRLKKNYNYSKLLQWFESIFKKGEIINVCIYNIKVLGVILHNLYTPFLWGFIECSSCVINNRMHIDTQNSYSKKYHLFLLSIFLISTGFHFFTFEKYFRCKLSKSYVMIVNFLNHRSYYHQT